MKKYRLISIVAVTSWVLVGIYGIIFNISYIDEAKYLIKGWLITSGQVGYYSTLGFFYQHMPGGWLWYGLGQKIFGPSLLVGRVQSFLVGLLILGLSFVLGKRLKDKKGGIYSLAMLSLGPVIALYYSAAVPQSILALVFLLSFIFLYDGVVKKNKLRLLLATVCFSLLLVIRENFLFSLVLYFSFLSFLFKKDLKRVLPHVGVAVITLGLFLAPGYPGTINVFKNYPGVSQLLPVGEVEQKVLSLYWKKDLQSIQLYFRALREFGIIFHAWFICSGWLILNWIKKGSMKIRFGTTRKELYWQFLVGLTGFNFLIHSWAAFKLSPRAIISYLAYIAPLIAVILGILVVKQAKTKKIENKLIVAYLGLILLAPIGIRFARLFAIPTRQPDLKQVLSSGKNLKHNLEGKEKIVWISEPMSLYLAGRVSYYPLINHINFYKPSTDTKIVKSLGFWNQSMLDTWLNEADLVVVGNNKIRLLQASDEGKSLAVYLESRLKDDFNFTEERDDIWPGELRFYLPKN